MNSKFKDGINKIGIKTILNHMTKPTNALILILHFYKHNLLKTPEYKAKNYAIC